MRCLPVAGGVHGEGRRGTWAIGVGNVGVALPPGGLVRNP